MSLTFSLALAVLAVQIGVTSAVSTPYEKAFRAAYRSRSIAACEAQMKSTDSADSNAGKFCTCVADRSLAAFTVAQLTQDLTPSQRKPIVADCLRAHLPSSFPVLWRTARLGMTRSQVEALFPLAHRPDHPMMSDGLEEDLVLPDQLEGKPAEVAFLFQDDGLAIVSVGLKGPGVDGAYANRVVAALTAQYGEPARSVDQPIPAAGPDVTQSLRSWNAGPVQISLMATPSIRPIGTGHPPDEHGLIVFYSPIPSAP